jgi:hypothetical protein
MSGGGRIGEKRRGKPKISVRPFRELENVYVELERAMLRGDLC